jgi:hypothetical protein
MDEHTGEEVNIMKDKFSSNERQRPSYCTTSKNIAGIIQRFTFREEENEAVHHYIPKVTEFNKVVVVSTHLISNVSPTDQKYKKHEIHYMHIVV